MKLAEEVSAEAMACYEAGELARAIDLYRELCALRPDDPEPLNDLGTVHFALGRMVESRRCYLEALRLDPDCAEALSNLKALCRATGQAWTGHPGRGDDCDDAQRTAEAARCARESSCADIRLRELLSTGAVEAAYVAAQERVAALPADGPAWNDLAVLADGMGMLGEARRCIQKALSLGNGNPGIRENARLVLNGSHGTGGPEGGLRSAGSSRPARGDGPVRVLFLEIKGIGPFLRGLAAALGRREGFEFRYVELSSGDEDIPLAWADVVWIEWANQLAIELTNRPGLLKGKSVVCRLHRFEAFTDMPRRINWPAVDALVFVSAMVRDVFRRRFPGASVQESIIHNGVDMDTYRIAPGKEKATDVAFVAHLKHVKNLPMLLQIARTLAERGCDRRICIAGDWQDPEVRLYFEHMVREMGLEGRVVCDGWVDDIGAWLADKRYLLSTSVSESFGYGVFEAMASGLRPVVHNYPGAAEFLPPEFLFNRVGEAADMLQASAEPPETYREYVDSHFPRRRQTEAVMNLLAELARVPAPAGVRASGLT